MVQNGLETILKPLSIGRLHVQYLINLILDIKQRGFDSIETQNETGSKCNKCGIIERMRFPKDLIDFYKYGELYADLTVASDGDNTDIRYRISYILKKLVMMHVKHTFRTLKRY